MFWSVMITLYVVRLIVTYITMRLVYLNDPKSIDLDGVIVCIIPLLGLLGMCYYIDQLPRYKHEKKVLDILFRANKQKKF